MRHPITSLKLWDLDAFDFWVVVLVLQSFALKSVILHFNVIKGADGVDIRDLGKSLELLLGLVKIKHFLHAVEMLSHVVLVFIHSKSSIDLIFVHF